MDNEKVDLHQETAGRETTGLEGWSGGAADQNIIELQPARYSAKAFQHGRHPTHVGRMESPDAQAVKVGWCGEVMEMYFRLDGNRIAEASFWADGCLSTMACGDMLTTLVQGKTLEEAAAIMPEELIAALGGLPFSSHHCAELSIETLQEAFAGRLEGQG